VGHEAVESARLFLISHRTV